MASLGPWTQAGVIRGVDVPPGSLRAQAGGKQDAVVLLGRQIAQVDSLMLTMVVGDDKGLLGPLRALGE